MVKYARVCFIMTRALGRRELGSRVLGVQYSGIFCCVLFISTELQNMDSGSSNRERCTLHLRSGGARNMKNVSMYHQENWENSSFNLSIIWLVTVHNNLTMFRHIDVAFHILMKSYNQSYNTFFMLPCVAACQDQCIHLHRLTGGTKNQDTHNMRMLRLPLMVNMDKREYLKFRSSFLLLILG